MKSYLHRSLGRVSKALMHLLSVLLLLSISIVNAKRDWRHRLIYGEKSMADFTARSRKLGIEVECRHSDMVALTFDDGPE